MKTSWRYSEWDLFGFLLLNKFDGYNDENPPPMKIARAFIH